MSHIDPTTVRHLMKDAGITWIQQDQENHDDCFILSFSWLDIIVKYSLINEDLKAQREIDGAIRRMTERTGDGFNFDQEIRDIIQANKNYFHRKVIYFDSLKEYKRYAEENSCSGISPYGHFPELCLDYSETESKEEQVLRMKKRIERGKKDLDYRPGRIKPYYWVPTHMDPQPEFKQPIFYY